ncbi:hypothetical protein FBULB1_13287 [Fusarium bulbicola]|nr:hypothetical protein FBULB1_13287 [Fusarium bulbicola]
MTGKAPTSVMKQRALAKERSEAQDEDIEEEEVAAKVVKNFAPSELNMDDIEFIDQNDAEAAETADGNLIEYLSKAEAFSKATFEFVVADEAHNAKKLNGIYNHMLRILDWKKLLWVSGTPILSSFKDLLSPLSLMWATYGLYDESYDPYTEDNTLGVGKNTTHGIFTGSYLTEFPQFTALKDIFDKSDGKCRLWMVNPDIFRAAGGVFNWGTNAGHLVVRPIFKMLQVRRTMRTPLKLPDGKVSYPAQDLLPSLIVLEEVSHDETKDIADTVQSMGQLQAKKLYKQKTESSIEDMDRSGTSQAINGQVKDHSLKLNFGEHRKGVLTSFDWRNCKILYPDNPAIFGHPDTINQSIKDVGDPNTVRTNSQMERENKKQAALSPTVVGVDKVEELLREDINGGLSFFFDQTNSDPSVLPPGDRAAYIHWLCYMSPVMTRTLELVWKYVREENERVLVYVDTPWIQAIVVQLFTIAGFDVVTVRPSDKTIVKNKMIAEWNNPNSGMEVFVGNVNNMGTGVNMHTCCCRGIFMNWLLNAKGMLQIIYRLIRINQVKEVKFHLLKLKNSYYDNIERICVTKWAIQLSAEVMLPDWMTDAVREICIFELIKTSWHQPFNRYAWVVERDVRGLEMEYHSNDMVRLGHVFSIVAKLLLDTAENYGWWVQNVDWIVGGCRELMATFNSPDEIEAHLSLTTKQLFDIFFKLLVAAVDKARERHNVDQEAADRHEQTIQGVRARKKQLSDEFVTDSDVEDEESSDVDDVAGEEAEAEAELEQADPDTPKGSKRKAEDDGRDGDTAKKQETNTA